LIITIAPDRDGKTTIQVSLRSADGTLGPPRSVVLNDMLAGFAATMQAFARLKLAELESTAEGARETVTQRSPSRTLMANRPGNNFDIS
jgi:hypothetical protein